jgi:hypothetical protein
MSIIIKFADEPETIELVKEENFTQRHNGVLINVKKGIKFVPWSSIQYVLFPHETE